MKTVLSAFIIFFAFFSPLFAMERISVDDDFADAASRRYPAFLSNVKLTLIINPFVSASEPKQRFSPTVLYPQDLSFPLPNEDRIGIKVSPQERYQVDRRTYPRGWASLAAMTQLLFLAAEITTKCRVCASPSDSVLDGSPQRTPPYYEGYPNDGHQLSYAPRDVRP